MRNTRKILVALLVLMTILVSLVAVAIPASAEEGTVVYLKPTGKSYGGWNEGNERYAVYYFGNGDGWASMSDPDGDGVYEATVPAGYTGIIFCRMNGTSTTNGWNNKWNQTIDLKLSDSIGKCYVMSSTSSQAGKWENYEAPAHKHDYQISDESVSHTCHTPGTLVEICSDATCNARRETAVKAAHTYVEGICSVCGFDLSQPHTVYFNNSASWAAVSAHHWVDGGDSTTWPGDKITPVDGVYSIVIPAGHDMVIFNNNNNGSQTDDLVIPAVPKIYNLETKAWEDLPHVHSWSDATCTEPQKCSCGETQGEALGHDYVKGVCSRCEAADPDYVPTCEHMLEQNVFYHPELVAATCCTTGVEIWECTVDGCDYYEKREAPIDPEAHAFWGDREVIREADCATKTNGLVKVACDNGCGQFDEVEVLYSEAHDWDVQKETYATCTEGGEYYAVCKICNEVESYSSEAQGHYNWYVTCGQTGNCMECGAEFTAEHNTAMFPASCTEAAFCMNCNNAVGEALGHDYVEGVCSRCEAEDPDYVAPEVNDKLINFSTWEEFAKGTYADGDVFKYNDIFTFIMGKNSRVDGSSKTWDDFSGTLRFSLGGKTNSGVPTKNAIQITVDGAHTLKIWYVAGGDGRYFELRDADGNAIATTTNETTQNSTYYSELEIPAAGVYYLAIPADNNYIFQLELVAKAGEEPETPHVNTLVVGETNKIVVSGNILNAYQLPIEWVPFVADEAGYYSFVGDNGALAMIFSADGTALLCGGTGKANLEAGNYLICVGNGLVGEFNVAVTKSAWVNTLAIGENKILITDALDNGYGYYIVWVPFEVTEKANYTFGGENVLALVYDAAYGAVEGTELEVGTYNICIAFLTPATTGVATVKVEKTAIGGETPVEPELPALQLGDNAVVIDGSQTNLVGNAVAWYTFTPANAGVYKFACSDLTVYILTSQNMGDLNAYVGADGVAELEAGVQYFILIGKDGVTGEFTLNISDGAAPVHKNTIVVGDNHYIISDTLLGIGYEFLAVEITEPGTYVITGGAPMQVYFFTVPGTLNESSPHKVNVDSATLEFVDSFEVTLTEAGTYWIGFRYDHVGDEREFDINISLGEDEPEEKPEQPAPELSLFEQIMKTINELIAKITAWFKSFVAGLKK